MRIRQILACLAVLVLFFSLPVSAATKEEQRVADAADVLDQFLRIPEQSIPPAMLSRAYAIAVVPNVVRIGFGLGARRGKGILVVRQDDNSWSNPAFVALTGGSFGFQAGVQSTDVILVFKSRRGVDNIANGKLTLGADASIAAGPVGRSVEGATDIRFQSEIVSYSRTRGIFGGVALAGSGGHDGPQGQCGLLQLTVNDAGKDIREFPRMLRRTLQIASYRFSPRRRQGSRRRRM